MRKIRILGIPTHFKLKKDRETGKIINYKGAVDFYRIIQPLMNLPKDKFEVSIKWDFREGFKSVDELTEYYDIIFSSYIDTVQVYVETKMACNRNNCKWIMDLDDNIWNVHANHPLHKDFVPESPKFQDENAIMKDVGTYTTTNSFLRYKMVENLKTNIKNITVMPNFIDLTMFDYKKVKERDDKNIQIGYMGGSSHFDDINKKEFTDALKIVMDKYPNVTLKTTFYMPHLKAKFGNKYKYCLGRFDVYRYADEVWPDITASDILVAPLSWSQYSRAKSYVKYLEYSAAKKPSILEKIDPYNEVLGGHPERGLQATTTEEWVEALSKLIESEKLRKEMGEEAHRYIKENHTIQKNVEIYADYFKRQYYEVLGLDFPLDKGLEKT